MLLTGTDNEQNCMITTCFTQNAVWTYPASVLAPATIWGIFRNSFARGTRFALFGGFAAFLYKYNKENGSLYYGEKECLNDKRYAPHDYDLERGIIRIHHADAQGWKGWPFTIDSVKTWWTPTVEPKWKKHVSPEEATRGPPTNF